MHWRLRFTVRYACYNNHHSHHDYDHGAAAQSLSVRFVGCVVSMSTPGSEYMSEFAKQAGMIAKLLSRYDATNPMIKAHTVELINRLVTYATRHLSLVGTYRSIPEEHLHLLATDVAQFTVRSLPAPFLPPCNTPPRAAVLVAGHVNVSG